MSKIENMEKMRDRVDKLSEDDSEKEAIHGLAIKENKERKRQKEVLSGRYGIQESLGSEGMNETVDRASDSFLETAEAREETMIDSLTGLRNRRAHEEDIPNNLAIVYKREKKECCYLLIDLDNFKNINETYGYGAGDTVLKEVANLIKEALQRESDVAYRRGGEEFVVFLPNAVLKKGAVSVAERIRERVAGHTFNVVNKKGQSLELQDISVSIGCGSTNGSEINRQTEKDTILKELEREANLAITEAKTTGKNKTIAYSKKLEKRKRPRNF